MKAASFDYASAGSVAEALTLLTRGGAGAQLMGGSQSLGPMLNLRLARPSLVVDVSRLPELGQVRIHGDWIEIGAAVTHAMIEDGVYPPLVGHPMQQVAGGIAYRAIRIRGTLGGSLAHADPAADWVVTMPALGARIVLSGPAGTREVAAEDFMVGAYTTVRQPDELITSVKVPTHASAGHWGYAKICRKPGEFSEASAAVCVDRDRDVARVVLGAIDGPPRWLPSLAAALLAGEPAHLDRTALVQAVAQALPERDRIDHKRFAACLERALAQAGLMSVAPRNGDRT